MEKRQAGEPGSEVCIRDTGASDPGAPSIKVDPSLRPGAKVLEQSAHRGLRSRLWKYVYVDGVETEKEILHTDTYMASKAITVSDRNCLP